MSTIRINQANREGYNPDGTPGTVSTGLQGDPGRPPTISEIADAVAAYITNNPITVDAVTASARAESRFGEGATGSPGSYTAVGSTAALHAFIRAAGTPQTVNLYLQSQNGRVIADSAMEITSTLNVDGQLRLISGAAIDGVVTLGDASVGTGQVVLTGGLAEVVATSAYEYTQAGTVQRGFLASELPTDLTNSTSKSSLMSILATLWNAIQELELRERTT